MAFVCQTGKAKRMNRRSFLTGCIGFGAGSCLAGVTPVLAQERFLLLGTTTTIEGSGLMRHVKEHFTAQTGLGIRSVVQGTGQILDVARRGDVDIILTHDPQAESEFVSSGYGLDRKLVFWNEFVLVGPKTDPAQVAGLHDPVAAFRRIAGGEHGFISRSDGSGTHMAEMRLWKSAGVDPASARPAWYRQTGSGQGASLNVAVETASYILSDRASFETFRRQGDLAIVVDPKPVYVNAYSVTRINPARHSHLRSEFAQAFADWLCGPLGQASVMAFKPFGKPLFHAAATWPTERFDPQGQT